MLRIKIYLNIIYKRSFFLVYFSKYLNDKHTLKHLHTCFVECPKKMKFFLTHSPQFYSKWLEMNKVPFFKNANPCLGRKYPIFWSIKSLVWFSSLIYTNNLDIEFWILTSFNRRKSLKKKTRCGPFGTTCFKTGWIGKSKVFFFGQPIVHIRI